ncbi:putative entry exclusion protein TrbK-alt [Asticcacaulis sp. W401b]|uniref:putative entry exclusion protein TrbK-alt n=1 Tax=Asticcacaulis sp. W401b TaxID=3388666 RepID=UPI00397109CA
MMDGKTLARLAAVIFVAVAIIATAIEMNRRDVSQDASVTFPPSAPRPDPLDGELARCSGIGESGSRDPACLKAWAENRRRFLGQPASAAPGPQPSSPENGAR